MEAGLELGQMSHSRETDNNGTLENRKETRAGESIHTIHWLADNGMLKTEMVV
jgi:hypothetical protein